MILFRTARSAVRAAMGLLALASSRAAAGAVRYDVERGLVSRLRAEDLGVCRSAFADGEIPAPGEAFFYVVRARNDGCGAIGSRGASSSRTERVNRNPDGCY